MNIGIQTGGSSFPPLGFSSISSFDFPAAGLMHTSRAGPSLSCVVTKAALTLPFTFPLDKKNQNIISNKLNNNCFFFFLRRMCKLHVIHILRLLTHSVPFNLMQSRTLLHMQQCTRQRQTAGQTSAGISNLRCLNCPLCCTDISLHYFSIRHLPAYLKQ